MEYIKVPSKTLKKLALKKKHKSQKNFFWKAPTKILSLPFSVATKLKQKAFQKTLTVKKAVGQEINLYINKWQILLVNNCKNSLVREFFDAVFVLEKNFHKIAFNPFEDHFLENPYKTYKVLRKTDPVHKSYLLGGWVVTEYKDVAYVLKNAKLFRSVPIGIDENNTQSLSEELWAQSMISRNGKYHGDLRKSMSALFLKKNIKSMAKELESLVDELLDEIKGDQIDIVKDIANQIPVKVIARIIGANPNEYRKLKEWSDSLAATADPSLLNTAARIRADSAVLTLMNYLNGIAANRFQNPKDDLISKLIKSNKKITKDHRFSLIFLFVAGHETTASLIGNGMYHLLNNREQFNAILQNPDKMDNAIEEMLRYDPPVQALVREATKSTKLGEKHIKKGERIYPIIGAANRDPKIFDSSETFDIYRKNAKKNISFGCGPHFCLGAYLGKLEATIVIKALIKRYPKLRIADKIKRKKSFVLRGVHTFPVYLQ